MLYFCMKSWDETTARMLGANCDNQATSAPGEGMLEVRRTSPSVLPLSLLICCSCSAISFLVDRMPLKWVMNHQLVFIMALMFVLQDLTNDVSTFLFLLVIRTMSPLWLVHAVFPPIIYVAAPNLHIFINVVFVWKFHFLQDSFCMHSVCRIIW